MKGHIPYTNQLLVNALRLLRLGNLPECCAIFIRITSLHHTVGQAASQGCCQGENSGQQLFQKSKVSSVRYDCHFRGCYCYFRCRGCYCLLIHTRKSSYGQMSNPKSGNVQLKSPFDLISDKITAE